MATLEIKTRTDGGDAFTRSGMKKVLVIGSGGAGKSTFAPALGRALGIEVVHLDALYWKPGWVETPKDEWRQTVEALTKRDSWVIDGNYGGTLELRLEACDTVVYLDLPRALCLWRIVKRTFMYRNRRRPDMGAGCRERLTWEFVRWVWNYRKRSRPKVLELLKNSPGKRVIRLRSSAEVKKFLENVNLPHSASQSRLSTQATDTQS